MLDVVARTGDGFEIAAAGHRIVHGGARFTDAVRIDTQVLAELGALAPLAPLHQRAGLAIVEALRAARPRLPQVAAFDTAFHASMPVVAQRFALPQAWFERGVRRYGFHGLSYQYVSGKLRDLPEARAARRVVVAHLGSGASLCALLDGASIATTMSFTPTDGLPMATRCGALDPSAVLYLMRAHALSDDDVERLLNFESGLLGVSGESGDIRALLASARPSARLAVDLFVHRIVVEAGALVAALGGLDALVFTGGIGAHQPIIRQRVAEAFGWLGVECDAARNAAGEAQFHGARSRVGLWNIATDEESIIAAHTARLMP